MTYEKEIFHELGMKALTAAAVNITATGAIGLVVDRTTYESGDRFGFLVFPTEITTADGTNYIDLRIYEAGSKSDASTLVSPTVVDATDILGWVADGARQKIANPAYVTALHEDAQIVDKYLPAATPYPRINATTFEGKALWFGYRGAKPCLQVWGVVTGTVDASFLAFSVVLGQKTRHLVNPAF